MRHRLSAYGREQLNPDYWLPDCYVAVRVSSEVTGWNCVEAIHKDVKELEKGVFRTIGPSLENARRLYRS